nr:tetratricopeptide repeat protein 19, mitochondrial-like [Onthophagus taurus]
MITSFFSTKGIQQLIRKVANQKGPVRKYRAAPINQQQQPLYQQQQSKNQFQNYQFTNKSKTKSWGKPINYGNLFAYIASGILPGINMLSRNDGPSDQMTSDIEDNITHLIVLAKIALEKGDIDKAEALLQMGLKICDDYKVSFGMPFIYDILASIAFAQGDSEKAERLLVTVIEKMVQDGVPDTNDHIIDFKLRLARIYSNYKENALAEIGFKTCLNAQKEKIINGDMSTKTGMLYVNVLFWYGVHMIKNARYQEAKKMIDRAYDYSNKIKGLSPYQEMVMLYTLADLNMELGEYDIALRTMQTAVMLGKGISSADLPKCYLKLAKIYMKMGVYDQAQLSAEESEKLARMFVDYR